VFGEPQTNVDRFERVMTRIAVWILVVTLAACGGSLTDPSVLQQRPEPAADRAVISGQIYANAIGHAPIAAARVEVNEADGSSATVASGSDGFYRIAVRRGSITITASKEGYEAKQWQFDLLNDTVLNFSLNPQ
jgi:hypothetical protein